MDGQVSFGVLQYVRSTQETNGHSLASPDLGGDSPYFEDVTVRNPTADTSMM